MNILGDVEELRFSFDEHVFEFALKKSAGVVVFFVEEFGISDGNFLDKTTDVV